MGWWELPHGRRCLHSQPPYMVHGAPGEHPSKSMDILTLFVVTVPREAPGFLSPNAYSLWNPLPSGLAGSVTSF